MSDNKTILKLYFEGYSQRQIAEVVKMSRKNTISPLIQAAVAQHLTLETIIDLSEEEVSTLLFPNKKYLPEYVQPDYEYCHKELLKDGVTLSLLYEEYVAQCRSQHKPFYKRTQFFDKYADYVKKHRLTMHINHKPADRVMVDWGGTDGRIKWYHQTGIFTVVMQL